MSPNIEKNPSEILLPKNEQHYRFLSIDFRAASLKELIIFTFDVYDVWLKVYFGTNLPTGYIALHLQPLGLV